MEIDKQLAMYKAEILALRLKIENDENYKKFIKANAKRSYWYSEYNKLLEKNKKLNEELLKKQAVIDEIREKFIGLLNAI